jgi:hypothetical protein
MQFSLLRAATLFAGIILGGVLLFAFDFYELNSPRVNIGLLLIITAIKAGYFLRTTLRWIRRTVSSAYHARFLMSFLALQVLLIVLSFAVDYYCLYRIDAASFLLPDKPAAPWQQMLTFLYFSLGKYTTAGGGDMHPVTPAAQACAMGEMVVSYVTTVLIIANVGYLQALFGRKPDVPG